MNDNYRPRHSLNSRYEDFDLDFDLDEDNVVGPYDSRGLGKADPAEPVEPAEPAAATSPARAQEAPAEGAYGFDDDYEPESAPAENLTLAKSGSSRASHSDEEIFDNQGEPADKDTSGLPMRGLIMILAAVGVLLIGWGIFTLASGDEDDSSETAAESSQDDGAQNAGDGAANAGQNADGQNADGQNADNHNADGQNNQDGNASQDAEARKEQDSQTGNNGDNNADRSSGAANNSDADAIDPAREYIAVLNNSPIQGLASDVSGKIREGDYKSTGFGNLPDETFPESVVLYPGDNDSARKAAEDLAQELGIRAEARTPETDRAIDNAQMLEGAKPGQIVVITTNNMPR